MVPVHEPLIGAVSVGGPRQPGLRGRFMALLLGASAVACGCSGSITTFNCTIDCADGSHHLITISADGGDACVVALASTCPSDTGRCSCNGSN